MTTKKAPKKTKAQEEAEALQAAQLRFLSGSSLEPAEAHLILTKRDTKPTLVEVEAVLAKVSHNHRSAVLRNINKEWAKIDRVAARTATPVEAGQAIHLFDPPAPVPPHERRRTAWKGGAL